jgi:mRNA deadenylase 3'-5' endonuclease subunit Ccr4
MSFTVATYNVLASAYIQRAQYLRTPAMVLNPVWRVPALVQYISSLKADILCLQEVEPEFFVALRISLGTMGYGAHYERKYARRPEGCAIFYRENAFELLSARVIAYADGAGIAPDTGHIALIALFQSAGGILGVINTHLTWDPPNTPRNARVGERQTQQLLTEYENSVSAARGWIIAGDFNVTPDSEIIATVEGAGLTYAHSGLTGVFTCNVNSDARMIDYIFRSSALVAEPQLPVAIDDKTILPSAEQPSDHVPIMAKFNWND